MSDTASTPAPSLGAILSKTVAPSAWVEFKESISFKLKYLPKARFRALADSSTEQKYDPVTKTRAPKINTQDFTERYLREAVLDWKGVTLKSLSRICEIDVSGQPPEAMETALPFTIEELTRLIDIVYDLDNFISAAVTDIKTFRPLLEEETKN
jgi:hypothetical protein